jgi:UDP-N-acetylglucosamine 2-epimerase (non-hydrolysing)
MKLLFVFGTRPEAIKMAPVVIEMKKNDFDISVCVTAQHRKMLDQVLDFFEIIPDYDLDLMQANQTLNQLSARILIAIDEVIVKDKPDLIFVHGDTTTSTIVALAAFHRGIKVGHVEAGLRTHNKLSPFPEEINRQITGRIADWHFAPTPLSAANLLNEKIDTDNIIITGNTVIDALQLGLKKIEDGFSCLDLELIKSIIDSSKKLIVITGHRRENFGDGFENLCLAIKEIALNDDVQIIYPVHLNPNVQEPVNRILNNIHNVHLIQPLDYPAFIYLMSKSYLLITDSGGVQEEAPSLGKPVIVMRDNTERPEAVSAGTVILVGTNKDKIVNACNQLLNDNVLFSKMSLAHNPYGDGKASKKIMKFISR